MQVSIPSDLRAGSSPADAESFPDTGPVFVVGMNGSGTTMLADSLGKHPQLYMFPLEIRVLPFLLQRHEKDADAGSAAADRRLADALGSAKPVWQANGWKALQLPDDALHRPGAEATVDAVFRHFAQAKGKQRWGEKSPMNLLHLGLLARVFPGARFVHIVRDGRDAAQSFHRRYGFCPPETIYRWKRVIAQGRAQGARLGDTRYLEVTYEQLTGDPEPWMRRICSFLGLPFDPVVLSSSMRMVDPARAQGAQGIMRNSGQWAQYFSPGEVAQLEAIAGAQLSALGYPVGQLGDTDPPRWKLAWWRLVGVMRRTTHHFRRWGWKGLPAYLRSLAISARQAASGRD